LFAPIRPFFIHNPYYPACLSSKKVIFARLKKYDRMALMKSISGIRGTIGGKPGETLSPLDVVKFTAAFGSLLLQKNPDNRKLVLGRDGRISGEMIRSLVVSTLNALGLDVVDLGLSTTPTVEMAVVWEKAAGGIILTASHNPKEWNALKLLNEAGEFISAEDGQEVLRLAAEDSFVFAPVTKLGSYTQADGYGEKHNEAICALPYVDIKAITKRGFKVVVDAINSTGATYVPALLRRLGVEHITVINEEITGNFAHNPEPLPEHLSALCSEVVKQGADLGIAVDPDVDRLCFVCEDGSLFGEEYTLVAVADYVLSKKKGNTVSNLSSTRALKEITQLKHGGQYYASAVGEVNVVKKMKEVKAVIGGEGNGGIILPDLHYGRDALVGIALFLSHVAAGSQTLSSLRKTYPDYVISKNKLELQPGVEIAPIFEEIKKKYKNQPVNTEDGLKIEFDGDWVHLRPSNTEPIIRIYSESDYESKANHIAHRLMQDIKEFMQ
jgi:phosphomannomutase